MSMMMNRRLNGKTSPSPSPRSSCEAGRDCEPLNLFLEGSSSSQTRKRLRSPRGLRQLQRIWLVWARLVCIALAAFVFVSWTFTARLIIESDETRNLKNRPATWIQNHALEPLKVKFSNFKKQLKEQLGKSTTISKKEQEQIIKLFGGVSQEEQEEVMNILQNVLNKNGAKKKKREKTNENGIQNKKLRVAQKERKQKKAVNQGLSRQELERRKRSDNSDKEVSLLESLRENYRRETEPLSEHTYADRHIQLFLEIAHSEVCKNPVVDFEDPNYRTEDAVQIFHKCRLLIFKNAFDKTMLEEYRQEYAKFIMGLKVGRISRTGSNTGGDSLFLAGRGRGRYEIVLPERLANPDIVANERILQVISDKLVLGSNMALRSLQSLVSEGNQGGGTPGQPWHYDQGFLFGQERGGLKNFGIAGHDLPPAAISLALPFLDMSRDLGPTEFCVGSSALNGVGPDVKVLNKTLIEEGSLFQQYFEHDGKFCPAECWRSPLLNFGDAVLWDYGVRHRGGWNASPFLRSILLLIYAKRWFDDVNFGDKVRQHPPKDEPEIMTDLMSRARLALPDRDEPSNKPVKTPLKEIAHIYPNEKYPWEKDHEAMDYIATNADVEGNPTLYIDGVPQGRLPAGSSKAVKGGYGDIMELRVGSKVVGRFMCSDDGQFVFTKDATW